MLRTGLQTGLRAVSRKSNNGVALRHMSKQIKFGVDGRNAMLAGVNTLADAVQVCSNDFNLFRNKAAAESHTLIRRESRVQEFLFCAVILWQNGILKTITAKNEKNPAVDFRFFRRKSIMCIRL